MTYCSDRVLGLPFAESRQSSISTVHQLMLGSQSRRIFRPFTRGHKFRRNGVRDYENDLRLSTDLRH